MVSGTTALSMLELSRNVRMSLSRGIIRTFRGVERADATPLRRKRGSPALLMIAEKKDELQANNSRESHDHEA